MHGVPSTIGIQTKRSLYNDFRILLLAGNVNRGQAPGLNIGPPQQHLEQFDVLAKQCLAERTAHTIQNNSLWTGLSNEYHEFCL